MTTGPAARPRSLRTRLLLRLMLPLLLAVAVTAAVGIVTANQLADDIFDRWILDEAQSVAQQVRFVDRRAEIDLPRSAQAILYYDAVDRVWFSVSQGSRHLVGDAGIAASAARAAEYRSGRAFDAVLDGQPVRVAAVSVRDGELGEPATVLVAETTLKRVRARNRVALMLLPTGLLLAATVWVIRFAVLGTVKPLELIARQWDERSHASLAPIDAGHLPRELMPFATALNDLLLRIRRLIARERQFTATAAHQLRTPLTGLQLGLARAAEAADLPTSRAVLQELQRATLRAARLIQQLLLFGRLDPEAGRELLTQPTDLVDLARSVGATFADLTLAKSIDLDLVVPDAEVIEPVQPDLIAEALANLLDNAVRHTPVRGRIEVRVEVRVAGRPSTLEVHDSGPGVTEADRRVIFQRFARGRAAAGEGSGLGLAIAREIAALHGAELKVDRSALGGACFQLRFADRPE